MTTYDSIKYKSTTISNLNDTGTEGSKLAVGTTAQRGSTTGQFRFNSTTGKFEGKNASSFIVLEASPTITSIDDTEVDSAAGGNQTIVITGTNFATGDAVSFIGTSASFNAATTTIDSATQITAVAPKSSFLNAQEPYGVRVTSSSGLAGNLESQINVDNAPVWQTSAGNLGTIQDNATGTHFTLSATDAEGDTVAYTETGATNISGAGMALNSSTGVISGDPTDVGSSTTVSFTGRATAGSKTADRAFNIIVTPPPGTTSGTAFAGVDDADGNVTSGNRYWVNTAAGSPEQLYFYVYNNYAYALVGNRAKSGSAQTSVNSNSQVGSVGANNNTVTFHLGVTKINYMIGQSELGMLLVPQEASGGLNTSNSHANIFRSSNSSKLIDTDIFTSSNSGEGANGTSARGVDLSSFDPTSYPTNYWAELDSNSHEGGNQILSIFGGDPNQVPISNSGTGPLGIRFSNNNGHGYRDTSSQVGNDSTGGGRNLSQSTTLGLFMLVR